MRPLGIYTLENATKRCVCVHMRAQSCPTVCDPMDYSPPGSSVHGVLQARILEWVAISFSGGSSQPRDPTRVLCIAGNSLPLCPPRKPHSSVAFPNFKTDCTCHSHTHTEQS